MTNRRTTIFAVFGTLLMIGMAASIPVAASDTSLSVDATQDDDSGEVLVSVTETVENESVGVSGANLTVEALGNDTYTGSGTYVNATENGTYTLPAPTETNESIEIGVTAEYDGASANTTAVLDPVEADEEDEDEEDDEGSESEPFGHLVSNFVNELQNSNDTDGSPMGPLVASFVLEHNPGDPPEHAGPPEWLVNDSVDRTQGPPDHAGPNNDSDRGPPDHAGPGDGNESDQGPPHDDDDRGPPHSDDDDDDRGPPHSDDDDRGPPHSDDDDRGPPGDRGN